MSQSGVRLHITFLFHTLSDLIYLFACLHSFVFQKRFIYYNCCDTHLLFYY